MDEESETYHLHEAGDQHVASLLWEYVAECDKDREEWERFCAGNRTAAFNKLGTHCSRSVITDLAFKWFVKQPWADQACDWCCDQPLQAVFDVRSARDTANEYEADRISAYNELGALAQKTAVTQGLFQWFQKQAWANFVVHYRGHLRRDLSWEAYANRKLRFPKFVSAQQSAWRAEVLNQKIPSPH